MRQIDKLNKLLLNLYGGAQECSVREFPEHALSLIKQTLHFDSAAVINASFSQDADLTVNSLQVHNQPIEKLRDRQDFSSKDNMVIQAFKQQNVCHTQDAQNIDKSHKDLIDYCKKYEVAHTLVLISPGEVKANYNLISLWRAKPKHLYTASDSQFGNLILPHLFQAKSINHRLFSEKHKSNQSTTIPLIAQLDGCLQFVEDTAIQLLQKEWPQWTPPILPSAFIDALKSNSSYQFVGKTFIANISVHNNLLFIQLSPKPSGSRLTRAEQAVAWLASTGASYKEIAKQLGTSPATVRNQLHAVYTKLDVTNKTSLAITLSSLVDIYPPEVHRTTTL